MFPLVLDYNPNLPNIGKILHSYKHLIYDLPPLQKYSPKGLLFHRLGDLKTFKTFFHTPIKLMIVALTSVVALNAKVNAIFVVIS